MSYYLADTAHGLRQAPRPCDVLGHGAMAVQSSLDCVKNLMEAILPMLRRSAQEIPHTETKRSKIFGLTVVIDLLRVQLSLVSEKFVSDASIVKKCERREQEKLLSRASSYHNHMLNHIHHIEAVKETAATSSLVLDTALCNLKSIAHDMQTEMEELRDHIETCVRRQNLHMTQQSIKESRSTVTCKFAADSKSFDFPLRCGIRSDRHRNHLRPTQSRVVNLWHERPGDQPHRPKDRGLHHISGSPPGYQHLFVARMACLPQHTHVVLQVTDRAMPRDLLLERALILLVGG